MITRACSRHAFFPVNSSEYVHCYEHGMLLSGIVILSVGKRVLQGLIWNDRQSPDLHPWPWRYTVSFSDKTKILENSVTFSIFLL
ncbi:unnamed protein product [Larinioides sclopetarius]|uniref:Uncharacterized protein n=1 Tax=Larinioides sclopetarius TaxID=280406 RepID=A0AAV1ZC61_9ARAC